MLAFFAFIVAMFISMVLIPPLMRSAQRLAFIDQPDERKVHETPIPRIGGPAMVLGAATPALLWVDQTRVTMGFLIGAFIILVFGLWDDRANLDYRVKFGGQLLAIAVAVFYGGILVRFVPLGGLEPIPHGVSIVLTIFALLGITNAINLADGLDGLAGGTTLLSIGALSLLAYLVGDTKLLVLSMGVMGAIIGFLRFNTHPAQIFMGDSGSQFLGYSAGCMVIILTQHSSTVMSPAMPLLLLGLPLIDTFLVMGQRLYEKRSPFRPDRNHIHHKLLGVGFDHYESVVVIYALQATLVSLAFVCRYQSDLLNLAIFTVALVLVSSGFYVASATGWTWRKQSSNDAPGALTRLARRLKRHAVLTRAPVLFLAVSMPVFSVCVAARIDSIPPDGRVTVYLLWCAAFVALVLRRTTNSYSLAERLLAYVTITTIVYYWCSARVGELGLYSAENVYFIALGLSILVAYRFGRNRDFDVTPTDFLIILIALLVPTLAGTLFPQRFIGEVAIKTLVLFYAVELVLAESSSRFWPARAAVFAVLSVLAARLIIDDIVVRAS